MDASYSATYDTLTVTVGRTRTCGPDVNQIIARTSGITITGSDESGKVTWVQLTTNLTMVYRVQGTKYVDSHSLVENDYS